jgi:hypothetical protein
MITIMIVRKGSGAQQENHAKNQGGGLPLQNIHGCLHNNCEQAPSLREMRTPHTSGFEPHSLWPYSAHTARLGASVRFV